MKRRLAMIFIKNFQRGTLSPGAGGSCGMPANACAIASHCFT
jgi:hypothetical protein